MTTIYVPETITSAEQAEQLPTGTLARHAAGSGMDHAHKLAPVGDPTPMLAWVGLDGLLSNAAMVGWVALVPVEAEEDWGVQRPCHPRADAGFTRDEAESIARNRASEDVVAARRLVTPWKEA